MCLGRAYIPRVPARSFAGNAPPPLVGRPFPRLEGDLTLTDPRAADQPSAEDPRQKGRLFFASFLMLFTELALIRWITANNVYVTEATNFVLLASFLGIGIGFLNARSGRDYLRWTPVALLVLVGFVLTFPVVLQVGPTPFRGVGHIAALPKPQRRLMVLVYHELKTLTDAAGELSIHYNTVERWHLNSDPPPFHKKVIRDKSTKVDRRNIATMIIPGIFHMETLFAAADQGAPAGNVAGAKEYRNCQFMTPETEKTTHFFWSYLNNFEGEDSTISRSLLDSLIEGFMEDKEIIERQQKTLDEDPSFQMLAILADAPLAHFRRLLGKVIDAERGATANQSAEPRASTTVAG
jgi:hypothetical protein